jgi:ADP-ribose pyrophosphatase YjhB (NUDIX family)
MPDLVTVRVRHLDTTTADLPATTRATSIHWVAAPSATYAVSPGSNFEEFATTLAQHRGDTCIYEPEPGATEWRTCSVESWEERADRMEGERDIALYDGAVAQAEVERLRWFVPKIERAAWLAEANASLLSLAELRDAAGAIPEKVRASEARVARLSALAGAHGRMPDVAVVVVVREGRVLTVARREPVGEQGLPGGRRKPLETPRAAAARELREETGLAVDPESLALVYDGEAVDGRWCRAYLALAVQGEPHAAEGLPVAFLPPDLLCALAGPFGVYLRRILDAVNDCGLVRGKL